MTNFPPFTIIWPYTFIRQVRVTTVTQFFSAFGIFLNKWARVQIDIKRHLWFIFLQHGHIFIIIDSKNCWYQLSFVIDVISFLFQIPIEWKYGNMLKRLINGTKNSENKTRVINNSTDLFKIKRPKYIIRMKCCLFMRYLYFKEQNL